MREGKTLLLLLLLLICGEGGRARLRLGKCGGLMCWGWWLDEGGDSSKDSIISLLLGF